MSALAGLFRAGGDPYDVLPKSIRGLPSFWRTAAMEVCALLTDCQRRGELDERLTTARMASMLGRSESFVMKGLYALHRMLEVIDRIRANGRRTIDFLKGLAARGSPSAFAGPTPPQTPPKTSGTKTTDTPASSSPGSVPEQGEEPKGSASAELIARACRLIPKGATESRVRAAAAVYGPEWVSRALDVVEKRNRKPGMKPVEEWGFVLRVLTNWEKEGGPPPVETRPAPRPAAAAPGEAREEPPRKLTAEEVADLVARCRQPERIQARLAQVELRLALKGDAIAPELAATIPPELLARE